VHLCAETRLLVNLTEPKCFLDDSLG
jgi:hypothetical protein